jgi:hypothetical protein
MFEPMRNERHRWLASGLFLACFPSPATASAVDDPTNPAGFVGGARSFLQRSGAGLELDGRYRFASEFELGLVVEGAYLDKGYLSGYVVSPALAGSAGLVLLLPAATSGPLDLFVRCVPGVAWLEGIDAGRSAVRQTNEIGIFGHVLLGRRGLLRAGVILGVELELDPTVDLADQSQAVALGYGYAVADQWLLYGDVTAGGTYGFNGDNGKAILEASLGVRVPFTSGGSRGAF